MQLKSLSEQVYDYVLRQIRLGNLKGGDKVSESQIAEELHTSRTPVKEAFLALAADGVLTNGKKRGFAVKVMSEEEIGKKFHVLAYLEALAATLAMPNLCEEQYQEMELMVDRMTLALAQRDYGFYYDSQEAFHDISRAFCENEYLLEIINDLHRSLVRTTVSNSGTDELFSRLEELNGDHKEIVRLFREKDSEKLERLIMRHFYAPEEDEVYVEDILF